MLKKGRQKCKIWPGVKADGLSDSTTPSFVKSSSEVDRLEKVFELQKDPITLVPDVTSLLKSLSSEIFPASNGLITSSGVNLKILINALQRLKMNITFL